MQLETLHWNHPSHLHPVGLEVLILVEAGTEWEMEGHTFRMAYDTIVEARRDAILESREDLRAYVDKHGNTFKGMYKWTYR